MSINMPVPRTSDLRLNSIWLPSLMAILLLGTLSMSACGNKKVAEFEAPSEGTPDSEDGDAKSADTFYVKNIKDDKHKSDVYLHKFSQFDAPCEIKKDDDATDLQCLLNVREKDLFFWGLKLETSLPRSMCKYYDEMPYFYYDRPAGTGPRYVQVAYNSGTNAITSCSVTYYPLVSGVPTETTVAGTISGNICYFVKTVGSTTYSGYVRGNSPPVCGYDHTKNAGPNCCEGKYTYSLTTTAAGTTSTTVTEMDWGGKQSNCLDGPAKTNGWPQNKAGWPFWRFREVPAAGISSTFDVLSPMSRVHYTNIFAANMFAWSSYAAGTHASAALPTAINPGLDFWDGSRTATNPAYTYVCTDESDEVKHRIRVYVNEFDTNEGFQSYVDSKGSTGSPNNNGVEGTGCVSEGSGWAGSDCNDRDDWDNLGSNYPEQVGKE